MVEWASLIIGAYLLGAVPVGFIIAQSRGIDLRTVGSGNIGATNLGRALGRKWAVVCFVLDALKGFVPTLAGRWVVGAGTPTVGELFGWLTAGCAAILGHMFPVYLRFRGGKGVSTGMGMLMGLYPYFTYPGLITFGLWGMVLRVWRYVSLASIVGAAAFPVLFWILIALLPEWTLADLWPLLLIAVVMAGVVVARHLDNIRRLLAGQEIKIGKR
jgi:acyl phosphate:glycerol-3-phosphate acyltransferase